MKAVDTPGCDLELMTSSAKTSRQPPALSHVHVSLHHGDVRDGEETLVTRCKLLTLETPTVSEPRPGRPSPVSAQQHKGITDTVLENNA